ncbi:hypothetical protein [Paraburkholderia solisilvae]|uniref:Uncharacterized protein n=1 Tax=Paraburkholderia solisilvae TaxID=624376 RepID=A0A6J5DES3_9BURK|nr:hypothetical protein [Paraburkholderia solisilvae]CAB3751485.1 hypothetical protein LMG29739_01293 [Paraburkholderia solisilvae]
MPVELPRPQGDITPPTPPTPIVWLIVFLVVLVAGVVSTLLTWPKGEPTGTAWFWLRLLAFPAMAGSLLYGLRLYYYQEEMTRLEAETETLADDRENAISFAREPLAVLAMAYLCAIGTRDVAQRVAAKNTSLESRDAPQDDATVASVRHTVLTLPGDSLRENRYRSCFVELLERLDQSLCSLPQQIPLEVYLQLPEGVAHDEIRAIWQSCWDAFGHRPGALSMLAPESGLMALDEWLDVYGGPALEKFAVFVAVQLYDTPPANSAEAATALLLGWAPLAERKGLVSLAELHRPVQAEQDQINEAASRALLWGAVEPEEISDMWQGGLERADRSALTQASSDLALAVSNTDQLAGIHDVDAAIGDAGVASPWLVIALAAEHAATTGKPQLAASRQHTLRLTVVQPVGETNEAGRQG